MKKKNHPKAAEIGKLLKTLFSSSKLPLLYIFERPPPLTENMR